MTPLLTAIHDSQPVYRLGWALLHSLWLGAAIAAAFALALLLLRKRSANARYLAGCAAMALLVLLPVAAFLAVPTPQPAPTLTTSLRTDPTPPDCARGDSLPTTPAITPSHFPSLPVPPPDSSVSPPPPSSLRDLSRRSEVKPDLSGLRGESPSSSWSSRVSQALRPALPWIVLAWLAGVFCLSLWNLAGWIAAARLKRLALSPVPPDLTARLASLAKTLRVSRPVKLLESALVRVPTVLGWLRPVILLPIGLASGLSPAQVDAILAHELAHIRRWDYLANLLQTVVETLLFYHPAVWFISRRLRAERENCCDDVALSSGAERFSYAESLLHVIRQSASGERSRTASLRGELCRTPALHVASSAKNSKNSSDLSHRIRRLLGLSDPASSLPGRSLAAVLVVLLALALPVGLHLSARASDTPPPASPQTQPAASRIPALIGQLGSPVATRPAAVKGMLRVAVWSFDEKTHALAGFAKGEFAPGGELSQETAKGHAFRFKAGALTTAEIHDRPGGPGRQVETVDLTVSHGKGSSEGSVMLSEPELRFEYGDKESVHSIVLIVPAGAFPAGAAGGDPMTLRGDAGELDEVLLGLAARKALSPQEAVAAYGIAGRSTAIERWRALTKGAGTREAAAAVLARLGDDEGTRLFARLCRDSKGNEQVSLVELIRQMPASPAMLEAIVELIVAKREYVEDWGPGVGVSDADRRSGLIEALFEKYAPAQVRPYGPRLLTWAKTRSNAAAAERIRKFLDSAPATQPAATRIPALIGQLGSPEAKVREEAQKALVAIGPPALEALKAAAGDKDVERATRAKAAFDEIEDKIWGPPMDGVRVRLVPEKVVAETGKPLGLMAEVRTVAKWRVPLEQQHCKLEVDGQMYLRRLDNQQGWSEGGKDETIPLIPVTVDDRWFAEQMTNVKLTLPPGKHTIRLAVRPGSAERGLALKPGQAFSNPVEVEVKAARSAPSTGSRPSTQPAATRIPALIGQLGSPEAKVREEAQKTLVEIGPEALGALRAATQDWDVERAVRSRAALGQIAAAARRAGRVGLYVITDPPDVAAAEKIPLEQLKLAEDPLICDGEIEAYEWGRHILRLTGPGMARLPDLKRRGSLAFVLVVDRQRCYLGSFHSPVSSYVSRTPAIFLEGPESKELPKNTIQIDIQPGAADPRGDARLRKALTEQGKVADSLGPPQWHKDRGLAIGREGLKQLVENLADFDDWAQSISASSVGGQATGSYEWAVYHLAHLFRVRKILSLVRESPEGTLPMLRTAYGEALAGWPEAYGWYLDWVKRPPPPPGHPLWTSPSDYAKIRARAFVATFLLAEGKDCQSLRLLYDGYQTQKKWLSEFHRSSEPRSPVPQGLTLYAMHRLVVGFPVEKLSANARDSRKAYLAWAENNVPAPKEATVSAWNAAIDESDPFQRITDPKGTALRSQPTMLIPVYPLSFKDRTPFHLRNDPALSDKGEAWRDRLLGVVKTILAAPSTGSGPSTQPAASRIPALIGQLGSPEAKAREEAQKALVEIGPPALDALKAAAGDKDVERATRARQAAKQIDDKVRGKEKWSEKTRRVVERIEPDIARVDLQLVWDKGGTRDTPRRMGLLLHASDMADGADVKARLTAQQALAVVDLLAGMGYFDRATEYTNMPLEPMPKNPPGYLLHLRVQGSRKYQYKAVMFEDLGGDGRVRQILEAMGSCLSGEPKTATAKIILDLSKDAVPSPSPASRPAARTPPRREAPEMAGSGGELITQEARLEKRLEQCRRELGPEHPETKQLEARLKEIRERLAASPQTQPAASRIPALIRQLGSPEAKQREEATKPDDGRFIELSDNSPDALTLAEWLNPTESRPAHPEDDAPKGNRIRRLLPERAGEGVHTNLGTVCP